MRWVPAAALVFAGLAPATSYAEVVVQSADGRVDLRATAAPLAEILDRLAKATGMKVVNEGPPPRQPLTLALAGRTPAEAVLGLLDGLGLNYALKMDATGTRVETLILSGAAPPSTATPPPAAPAPVMRPPQPVAPQVEAEEEEPPPEEEAQEPDESQQPQTPGVKAQKAEEGQTNAPVPGMRPAFPMMPAGQPFPVSPFAPVAPPLPTPAPATAGQPAQDASGEEEQ